MTLRACTPPTLVAFLNSGAPYFRANLLTIELASGVVYRLTDYEVDVNAGALGTFPRMGRFHRSSITHRRGVEVDTMTLNVGITATDTIGGVSAFKAIRAGALDYAHVRLDIGIFSQATPTVLEGYFNWFTGDVADIPGWDEMGVSIECKSFLSRLDIPMPRNLVQPGCLNTLFDRACGLVETAWRSTGTVTSVNVDGSLVTSLSPATGHLDEGRLVITSGDNSNVIRKIKRNTGGTLFVFSPFVFPITPGTTFRVTPGCPKTQSACNTKFSNVINFRGMPYVPTPEAIL